MTQTMDRTERRFGSPFDIPTPAGAEGWERLFPAHMRFTAENREYEDSMLWFRDGIHHPEVEYPFDSIIHETYLPAAGAVIGRTFVVPPSYGIDMRVINGYVYAATVPVTDPEWIGERVPQFLERAGFYYQNWDELFIKWKTKVRGVIADLQAIDIPELPRVEDMAVVTEGRGRYQGYALLRGYDAVIGNLQLAYEHHFEMLPLGYAAYLNLFQFCKGKAPATRDDTIAQMAAGTEIMFFRPDDELKALAQKAIDLGLADRLKGATNAEATIAELRTDPAAAEWVAYFDSVKDPWFYFNNGNGMSHATRSWIDDMTVPWQAMVGYIERLERGETLERPQAAVLARRDELTAAFRDLLETDEDRTTFDQNVGLARTVAAYIEDHNFHIEHWHHTIFWQRIREYGDRLVSGGFLNEREDIFYLTRWEVAKALYELVWNWSVGAPSQGKFIWKQEVEERKAIMTALRKAVMPPAFGPVPDDVTEPFSIMLWGITNERLNSWLDAGSTGDPNTIAGVAGSPGQAEGLARVLASPSELSQLQAGEILVCPITAPSWGPVFGKIGAAVCDAGGIMSHAAIVCREYGLPAVVGTGNATARIKTGDRLRVDGNAGTVTIVTA